MLESQEKKKEKKIAALLRRSAVAVGAGLGFLILIPFLPNITDVEKMNAMKELFSLTAMSVIGYGLCMTGVIFFMRKNALSFDLLMNFLVVPSYGIWFAMKAYGILTG